MGRVHIFAQYGNKPAQAPIVTVSANSAQIVAELEADGAQVVVLDDDERITYGLLTKELIAAHPELAV